MKYAGFSRRALIGGAGAGLAVGATAGALGRAVAVPQQPHPVALGAARVDFHGPHQAGITQPQQARVQLAAFDLAPGADRKALQTLLKQWTGTVRDLVLGEPGGPHENQIALDAGPCSLTVTVAVGASLFDKVGLTAHRPPQLAPLPAFPQDAIDRSRSDGDLFLQIGADDALVAFHALRMLQQQAAGTAAVRWQAAGFSRTPGATAQPRTARNLMGQVDGTNNPKPTDADFAAKVFATGPDWLAGGSYLVFRRIRMLLDDWENLPTDRQERIVGRRKADGAPLSGGTETTPVDLAKQNPDGGLAVPADAHIRIAAPSANGGAAMLRRGFSYADGTRPDGSPDAGLLFLAFQADPAHGFLPVQRSLSRGDVLTTFLRHEASGLYAVLPGVADGGGYLGQALLEA
ncbi:MULTISPECIES: iron uptake transporter deferrochelatase/peroxidase subunit [Kitasatospora]|uniref:iron uptake transporter deferrochelatase/peroxidase subunit n=1 Tax=Kitasatospora TaxID=2063 RepID=UPI000C6FEA31|nr:iron uptake transporter deferrochelatase/peroxidase subunit [Kitasatospora sp. GP30]MDH6141456.1 dye decolorizing peroxidase [Kitasatospora sp. GP30]